jgi:hypothetical protein
MTIFAKIELKYNPEVREKDKIERDIRDALVRVAEGLQPSDRPKPVVIVTRVGFLSDLKDPRYLAQTEGNDEK